MGSRHLADFNAYDFGPSSRCRSVQVTQRHYEETHTGEQRSPWSLLPAWSIFANHYDLLHLVYLGFARDLCATFLLILAHTCHPHEDLNRALYLLWDEMKHWFRNRGRKCVVKRFDRNAISWKDAYDYPTLSSRIKGANVKLICIWLSVKMVSVVEDDVDVSAEAQLRASCMWSLMRCIGLMDHSGLFLSDADAEACASAGEYFLVSYQTLAWDSFQKNECLYKVRPKLHDFAHLCDFIRKTKHNPRRYDLFGAEDYMKRVKQLGKACHRSTAHCAFVRRYIWFLAHRWHKSSRSAARR